MADTTIGAKLVLDSGAAQKSMKEFKAEIKDARTELLNVSAAFGSTSKEALTAAKRVAELEDNIKDASETAKLFDPGNKFQVLGNAVRGLVGGFTALQGALALVGVEGEEVQKTLLKVQGALALTEGLNTVADVAKDFKRLGSVLVQTLGKSGLIGVAIAGVTALGLALSGVFNRKQKADLQAYNDTLKDYTRAAATARQTVTEVKVAFEQAREGVITKDQALKVYNETLGDAFGKTNDLTEAENLLTSKADDYIKITGLKAQANALFTRAAESSVDALIAQDELIKSGILNENGVVGTASRKLKERADTAIADAKKIEELGVSLLKQAGQLSQSSNINTGGVVAPGGSKLSPASQARVQEEETLEQFLEGIREKYRQQRNAAETAAERARNEELLRIKDVSASDIAAIDNGIFENRKNLSDLSLVVEKNNAQARVELSESEAEARIKTLEAVGSALGALGDLIGQETAAGKVLSIAQAVINTYTGATKALAQGGILGIASAVAVIASGLASIKKIVAVKVPGQGSTGNIPGGSLSAPLQPQAPAATNTFLNQGQLNQIGNATVRAFVVESDVSSSQERIRRLNRAARI